MKMSKETYTKLENAIIRFKADNDMHDIRHNVKFVNCQFTAYIWHVFHNAINDDIRDALRVEKMTDSHIETALKKILKAYNTGCNNEEIKKQVIAERQEKEKKKKIEAENRKQAENDEALKLCYAVKDEKYLKGEHIIKLADYMNIKITDNLKYFLNNQLVRCDIHNIHANIEKIDKRYIKKIAEILYTAKDKVI